MAASRRQVNEYLETVLWIENDESDERGGEPLDRNYSVNDFSPEARARAQRDLDMFQFEMQSVLDAIGDDADALDLDSWPYDFWLTRNGHGVGFWDRPERYGPLADVLTALAKRAGELHAYVGDDGQVHFG